MIIYIHGFGGSGQGIKAKLFREYYKDEKYLAPSLSYVPALAISTLCEIIETFKDENEIKLIGSSLGGYYAIYLANKYNLKAVLINPSIHPEKTLKKSVGKAPSFYDASFFSWAQEHLSYLEEIKVDIVDEQNYFLLVQTEDEILDYREAVHKFPHAKKVIEDGGNHSFVGIEKYFSVIDTF